MGVEVYDAVGLLHSINDYALKMYGVEDRNTVIGAVNLFNSPYVDEELKTKIQRGEDIVLEFEYDFDRINRNAYFSSKNKNSMIYEVKIVPVRNKKEVIIGHILLTNDVTAKKEAEFHTEESKKNLEMAVDAPICLRGYMMYIKKLLFIIWISYSRIYFDIGGFIKNNASAGSVSVASTLWSTGTERNSTRANHCTYL